MTTPDHIRTAVSAAIVAQGLTLTHVAKLSGVHRGNLSRWLAGKGTVTTETASRVLAVLKIGVDSGILPGR